jgi:hypothetical protein
VKELPQISLRDALELTVLIARKEPRRHPRVAVRWLLRYRPASVAQPRGSAALRASLRASLRGQSRLLGDFDET